MPTTLIVSLVAVFVCVALVSGLAISRSLSWATLERKRLRNFEPAGARVIREDVPLQETPIPSLHAFSRALPKSPKEMSRLRRRLAAAGHYDLRAAVYYSMAKLVTPVLTGGVLLALLGSAEGWYLAVAGGMLGYMVPDLILARMARARASAIEDGLPDALDLLILCIEAGSSLDQSVAKASDELELSHPALAGELRWVTTEIRAGKPRLEAFKNFATRTNVDDVRSLVAMWAQTDRFGTSVAQALRVQAEASRTKRRQRAEERAATIGVKLVFPLVLCIFPAVYVVCIGPVVIAIYRGLS
jgi:tight adherence protein C